MNLVRHITMLLVYITGNVVPLSAQQGTKDNGTIDLPANKKYSSFEVTVLHGRSYLNDQEPQTSASETANETPIKTFEELGMRNTIKFHVVSTALFTKTLVLSYERITRPNQSLSIMAGYVQFPQLRKLGPIKVADEITKNGLTVVGEYRFYLKNENKYSAPHGVYVGPYANWYRFGNDRVLNSSAPDGSSTTSFTLKSDIAVTNVGFEMGYQFVIKNRWTVDMVFIGPSLSRYSLNLKLDGNYDVNEEEIIKDEILTALVDRFPIIKDLLSDKEINLQGRSSKWAPGFRYQLNIGYRFGKIKKK